MEEAEREARVDPLPGRAALEADERAPVKLVPQAGVEVVDWTADIISEETFEICEHYPVFQGKDPAEIPQGAASSSKEPMRKLAAPPLYAAEVAARASQLTTLVKQELSKALDLCAQIQGALSQGRSEHLEVVD
eukprot:s3763_g5.t1